MNFDRVIYQWIMISHDFVDVDMGELFQREKERTTRFVWCMFLGGRKQHWMTNLF
jgi:hypothetical protein